MSGELAAAGRWESFQAGYSAVDVPNGRYVLRPAAPGSNAPELPESLHGLYIITSDNPGGFLRSSGLNRERRSELRAEMVSLYLLGKIGPLHYSLGWANGAGIESSPEVGLASRMDLGQAIALGHGFGQLAIYQLVPQGRRLLACALLQRNIEVPVQPMSCEYLPHPR